MARSTGSSRERGAADDLGLLGLLLATALLVVAPAGTARASTARGWSSFDVVYDLQPDGSVRRHRDDHVALSARRAQARHLPQHRRADGVEGRGGKYRYFDLTDVDGLEPVAAPPTTFRVSDNGAAREIRIGSADQWTSGTQVYEVSYTLHDVLNPITADGEPDGEPSRHGRVLLQRLRHQRVDAAGPGLDHRQRTGGVDEGRLLSRAIAGSDTQCQATAGDPTTFSADRPRLGRRDVRLASYPAVGLRRPARRRPRGRLRHLDRLRRGPGRQRGGLGRRHRRPRPRAGRHGHARVDARPRRALRRPHPRPVADVRHRGQRRRHAQRDHRVRARPPWPCSSSRRRGVQPGMVGTIVDETANPIDVSATVIDLAVRGFLRIEEIDGTGVFSRTDWNLTRLEPPPDERPAALRAPAPRRHLQHPGRRRRASPS